MGCAPLKSGRTASWYRLEWAPRRRCCTMEHGASKNHHHRLGQGAEEPCAGSRWRRTQAHRCCVRACRSSVSTWTSATHTVGDAAARVHVPWPTRARRIPWGRQSAEQGHAAPCVHDAPAIVRKSSSSDGFNTNKRGPAALARHVLA